MKHFHRYVLITALAVLASASFVSAKSTPAPLAEAVNYEPLSNPGPAPKFDPAAYSKYRLSVAGTATVAGPISVKLTSGEIVPCGVDDVELYPDTPYTEWMIAKWASIADRHRLPPLASYPGDQESSVYAPWWLHAYINRSENHANPQDQVVRLSECRHGIYKFENVPPGKYLLESMLDRKGGEYTMNETSGAMSTENTPDGPQLVEGGSTFSGGGVAISDMFIVAGVAPLVITEKQQYYWIDPSNLKVISHPLAWFH